SRRVRIGVARDAAFQFYYAENLDLLREAGAELHFWSPLDDHELPDVDGLYLGGGYPELHARRLSENTTVKKAVRRFAEGGRPVYAECGGLMYLAETLEDADGVAYPMAGVLPAGVRMRPRRMALGYTEVALTHDTPIGAAGAVARVHVASAPAAAFSARDMLGREVALAAPPARIVSLVPSVTEVLFALGAEARLVGVTDFCDYPPAARAKPSVGGMVNPNLEAIVALRPDLVIATTEGNREETFAQLKRLGIPTYLVAAHHVRDVTDLIARLGALTGYQQAAGPLLVHLERRVAAVTPEVAPLARPRVLYVL